MFGRGAQVFQPTGQHLSWYVASSPTSDGGGCRSSSTQRGNMAAPACSVRYFCLGALLIFVGSVLLCALGFTVVLPHEATADWPRVICTVVNATYNKAYCSCDQQVTEYDRCVEHYPCLQVTVGFNKTTHQGPVHGGITRASFATGILYRNWVDSFFRTCSIHECGDEEWNVKEAHRFLRAWGRRGQTYPCFYDPLNDTSLVLERMPTSYVIHALFWPSLSLLSGTLIWLGLCFGCWRIECSIHECGDEEWNVKEAHHFLRAWGRRGQTYPCYYDPLNDTSLVLERMPTSYVIHALFWPSLSLLSGTLIWLGLCFGCWRIECPIHECGDEEWNVKEAHRFLQAWGRRGHTYPCFYDPLNDTSLVLERMPTSYVIHALFWPSLSLLSGTLIWMGLCFGCWRIEIENTYPQRHEGSYARGPYGML